MLESDSFIFQLKWWGIAKSQEHLHPFVPWVWFSNVTAEINLLLVRFHLLRFLSMFLHAAQTWSVAWRALKMMCKCWIQLNLNLIDCIFHLLVGKFLKIWVISSRYLQRGWALKLDGTVTSLSERVAISWTTAEAVQQCQTGILRVFMTSRMMQMFLGRMVMRNMSAGKGSTLNLLKKVMGQNVFCKLGGGGGRWVMIIILNNNQ